MLTLMIIVVVAVLLLYFMNRYLPLHADIKTPLFVALSIMLVVWVLWVIVHGGPVPRLV